MVEIVRALRGTYRLARLDATGLDDFNATIGGFWNSFLAAVIVAPGYAIVIGPGLARMPTDDALRAILAEILAYITAWTAFPLLMIHIAERIGRDAAYIRFIVAYNWSSVIQMMVLLTAALIGASMPVNATVMLHVGALGLILAYRWFIARTALQVNGGTAMGIVGLGMLIEFMTSTAAALVGAAPGPAGIGQ
ncbi:MAG: hypothetical protein U1E97_09840 [Alphaproteobacteria bacterium]